MTRTEWNKLLFSNPTRWQRVLSDVDVILGGYWPYDGTKDHTAGRTQLEKLLSVLNVRLCPTCAQQKPLSCISSLQRAFGDKQIVIPSVYLAANSSVSTLCLCVACGLFEHNWKSCYSLVTATLLPHDTNLKLYFDVDGHLLVAFANTLLPKKRGTKETDVEVFELRRDIHQQWLNRRTGSRCVTRRTKTFTRTRPGKSLLGSCRLWSDLSTASGGVCENGRLLVTYWELSVSQSVSRSEMRKQFPTGGRGFLAFLALFLPKTQAARVAKRVWAIGTAAPLGTLCRTALTASAILVTRLALDLAVLALLFVAVLFRLETRRVLLER